MARSYDPTLLVTPDVTNLEWATAYVRNALRDVPDQAGEWPEGGYTDEEIKGALALHATKNAAGVSLYAPHIVAAHLIEADPSRAVSMRADDIAETLRDPRDLAEAIRRAGRVIDALVVAAGGPDRRTVARVLF